MDEARIDAYLTRVEQASPRLKKQLPMSSTVPPCRTITVFTFRGNRSRAFAATFLRALNDQKSGRGAGPTIIECQLFTGHTGVSLNGGATVWGFNPDGTGQYSYGFPNGDGDCNCITWLERLGLPLLTGRMNEFAGLLTMSAAPKRRFGRCV